MRAVLNLIIVVSAVILAFSLGFLAYYKFTFNPSASFSPSLNSVVLKSISENMQNSTSQNETEVIPDEVVSQVKSLSSVIPSYFVMIRSGLVLHPALILKTVSGQKGLEAYLLTFYPMEWPFAKILFPEKGVGKLLKVYQCEGGLLLLDSRVKGFFPIEVGKGELNGYGAMAIPDRGSVAVKPFDVSKGCRENGFVFNLAGDFSGVCFGGEFYGVDQIVSQFPGSCKEIYPEEEESGNVQGQNG